MEDLEVKMVRSAKGKDMLLVANYLFHYDDRTMSAYRWVCSRRKDIMPCRVRLYTTLLDETDETRHKVLRLMGEHPHGEADKLAIKKAIERKRFADELGLPCTLQNYTLKRKLKREANQLAKKVKLEVGSDLGVIDKKVIMLKTSKGYHMVAVKGCVYRLDGKSMVSSTFRWKCFRSKDLLCTARIYTECLSSGEHRFKDIRAEEAVHNHEPYTDYKINALIRRNKIKILQGNEELNTLKEFDLNLNQVMNEKPIENPLKTHATPLSGQSGGKVETIKKDVNIESLPPLPSLRREKSEYTAALFKYVKDPVDVLHNPKEGNITKFTFLPSLKGNKVLCVNNIIYHYDSKGTSSGRAYWTCLYRRDKQFKCNGRITTETVGGITKICKVSSEHNHPDHREQIEKRIKKPFTLKKQQQQHIMTDDEEDADHNNDYHDDDDDDDDDDEQSDFEPTTKQNIEEVELVGGTKIETVYDNEEEEQATEQLLCKLEADPFKESVEYVEMERVTQDEIDKYRSSSDQDEKTLSNNEESDNNSSADDDDDNDEDSEPLVKLKHKSKTKYQKWLKRKTTSLPVLSSTPDNIDITKVSKLRSAKGGELLCVDGFIYHLKSISANDRTYWTCIKSKDRQLKCPARVTTVSTRDKNLRVAHLSNKHTHPISEEDIKRRLFNEYSKLTSSDTKMKVQHILDKSMSELNSDFASIVERRLLNKKIKNESFNMKLYAVSDGPPSLAVRMCLKALNIPYELKSVDYIASEHMTEEYAKMNPQKEIPVLDDDGFYLSESVAIMQYLCDKYGSDGEHSIFYPADPKDRALVNHRLCFNMAFYYPSISAYVMAPIFFDYERSELGLKKVHNSLSVFETYLQRSNMEYAASSDPTIADFALISSTLCLEAIDFNLKAYPLIYDWYQTFKRNYPELWEIAGKGMEEIMAFNKCPPDMSHMQHPFHPTKRTKSH